MPISGRLTTIFYILLLAVPVPAAPTVFILGDLEKPTGNQKVEHSASVYQAGKIRLAGAGNEVVAFQALLQAYQEEKDLRVTVSDLQGASATLRNGEHIALFLEHYITSDDASYSWGPGGAGVLRWRGLDWPDALVPLIDPYGEAPDPLIDSFSIEPREHRNQAVWIDILIPKDTPAGVYAGVFEATQAEDSITSMAIELDVHPFNLPDETHVDAWGELYRENGVMFDSGVKFKEHPEEDWKIYQRYLQLGHAHRFLPTHRAENGPLPKQPDGAFADAVDDAWGDDWSLYSPYVDQILTGRAFTPEAGYRGPCVGAPPRFYPAPFIEAFYGARLMLGHLEQHGGRLDPKLLRTWRENARVFWTEVERRGWTGARFFAYIMDEVDSSGDNENERLTETQVASIHRAMADAQAALDDGTGGARRIHLLWTSQADPAQWSETPADLRGRISWWVPNGHALNVDFFKPLAEAQDQTVWFYHSGHPAIGNHAINQTGVDLCLWGLLCRRYPAGGFFLWSMMGFANNYATAEFNPYEFPSYKVNETRWGNGTLFYPGSRLTMIGARNNIAGPIPSLRMKALRRGLQDYEYCWLADQAGHAAAVDEALRELIPKAFSEAPRGFERGRWSEEPEDYAALREKLAGWIVGGIKASDAP